MQQEVYEAEIIEPPRLNGRGSKYPPERKAEALALLDSCGGNMSQAARLFGVPRTTLHDWQSEAHGINDDVRHLRQEKRGVLADAFEEIAWRCLEAMTPEKITDFTQGVERGIKCWCYDQHQPLTNPCT